MSNGHSSNARPTVVDLPLPPHRSGGVCSAGYSGRRHVGHSEARQGKAGQDSYKESVNK